MPDVEAGVGVAVNARVGVGCGDATTKWRPSCRGERVS